MKPFNKSQRIIDDNMFEMLRDSEEIEKEIKKQGQVNEIYLKHGLNYNSNLTTQEKFAQVGGLN